ncbi:tripartite tricarboxylate transporter substrate binding protein [Limnohabitans sp. G3-2]|uniref:Bug family tripartite tricarboxylate transporter substrate binding protein n=1 Tax=Limnohabitans sp. G3-2 TaxID=1100711 RepID=UPI0013040266|nr:tripartite tricarboxylate transporter substrate binding protein [Limnohabitans sp. G3-2]
MNVFKIFIWVGLLFSIHLLHAANPAQVTRTWPQRPVTLIVPFGVGGATDQFARLLAPQLSSVIGQPVIIDNVAGAGGAIGIRKLLDMRPDGHVLLLGGISETILIPLNNHSIGYKPLDLQAVSITGSTPLVIVKRHNFPAKNLSDMVNLAHLSPMKYTYGSSGPGSYGHLMFEKFAQKHGIQLLHVPYKGSSQMMTDMASGQIDAALTSLPSALPYIKSGLVELLGVSTPQRLTDWPQLPTFFDSDFAQEPVSLWGGVFVPRGLRKEVAQKINAAFDKTLMDANLRANLTQLGILVEKNRSPSESQTYYERQIRQYQYLANTP